MTKTSASVSFATHIDAPLDAVRAAVHDPAWSNWIPFLKSDTCHGDTAGSARVCVMAHPDPQLDGYELQETIVENDRDTGRFGYAIKNPPFPVENLGGVVTTEQTDNGVLAIWTAHFDADPAVLEEIRPMMVQSYHAAFQGLESHANKA
ncbi:SRPBCC family protein [Sulfitobacter sp. M368]|uniref:SRPBCC family protein n=1 Tax=Sulfitobacter sp. M368 TaxID=2867021 RepID=UPI0021A8AE12|nr:SRPBCC family protein [Sulfitobacter sp. M368]UWR14893.1 SRPBCC family protein [Sulfitobacter sp. M368]